jgi:hypothetical protein
VSPERNVLFGISVSEIASICQVDLATARRWKRGATCPPAAALMLLSRDLGYLDPDWRGWRIQGGLIISPDQWTVSRNDALSVPLLHGQIAALRHDLARAREQLEELKRTPQADDQPLPSTWVISLK